MKRNVQTRLSLLKLKGLCFASEQCGMESLLLPTLHLSDSGGPEPFFEHWTTLFWWWFQGCLPALSICRRSAYRRLCLRISHYTFQSEHRCPTPPHLLFVLGESFHPFLTWLGHLFTVINDRKKTRIASGPHPRLEMCVIFTR